MQTPSMTNSTTFGGLAKVRTLYKPCFSIFSTSLNAYSSAGITLSRSFLASSEIAYISYAY